jgi:F-type H+-transporting ATPase subunit delta
MRDRKAALRFARAFFEEARRREAVDQAARELLVLKAIWVQTPELIDFLSHPLVPYDRKAQVCREHLGSHVQAEQIRLLEVLIERRRVELLPDIVDYFQLLADEHHGIVRAKVQSAVPLTEDERTRLGGAIAGLFGGQPVLDVSVHPELVGGVTVRVKDAVVDGSVRTSLRVLRADLQAATLDQPAASDRSED